MVATSGLNVATSEHSSKKVPFLGVKNAVFYIQKCRFFTLLIRLTTFSSDVSTITTNFLIKVSVIKIIQLIVANISFLCCVERVFEKIR